MVKNKVNILVVGAGAVGLTLAAKLLKTKAVHVTLLENNIKRFSLLQQGNYIIDEPGMNEIFKKRLKQKRFIIKQQLQNNTFNCIFICIGTPRKKKSSDSEINFISLISELSDKVEKKGFLLLRSTVPIGTTRKISKHLNETGRSDINLLFAPERTAEGVALQELDVLPQIIGATNDLSLTKAEKFLSRIGFNVVKASSCESAEFIKLISNSWRDASFALSNEIAVMAELLGLDSSEAISVANYNYPRSNIPRPGPVGGPCLSKDSYILLESFHNSFIEKSMIANARFINEQIEINAFNKIKDHLLKVGSKSSTLFLGAAFKGSPPTNDTRNGVTADLVKMLIEDGIETKISIWDPTINDQDLFEFAHLKIDSVDEITPNVIIIGNNAKFLNKPNMRAFFSSLPRTTFVIDLWGVTDSFNFSTAEIYRLGLGTKTIYD